MGAKIRASRCKRKAFVAALVALLLALTWIPLLAFDLVPSEEEIQKYRKSWNPFSHGLILLQAVDIQPKGQASVREFVFSQIGEHSYGNRLSFVTDRKDGPVHLYAVSPSVNVAYGLTNHIELGAAFSVNSFRAKDSEAFNYDRRMPDVPEQPAAFNIIFEPEVYLVEVVSGFRWWSAAQQEEVQIRYRKALPAMPAHPLNGNGQDKTQSR